MCLISFRAKLWHHAVITISKLVRGNFPGGLKGSISLSLLKEHPQPVPNSPRTSYTQNCQVFLI